MIIKSCYIESFGILEKRSFVFNEGLNIIEDDNGKGKTTLSVFIKAMFYGMEYSKKRKELTEREKYLPWQGGNYGGRLVFAISGKEYEITRYFGKKKDEDFFELRDIATGKTSEDYSENIGEEIFGIDAESFERSIFISLDAKAPAMQDSINAKLGDLIDNTDDINNFESAYGRLSELAKSLKPLREGGEEKLIRRTERLADEKLRAIKECEEAEKVCKELSEEKTGLEKRSRDIEDSLEDISEKVKKSASSEKLKRYNSINDRVAERKKDIDASLSFFSGGKVPNEEDIRALEDTEKELSSIEQRLNELKKHYGSEDMLLRSVEGIKEILPEGFPSEEEESEYMRALSDVEKEEALLSADNPLKPSERELSEYESLKKKHESVNSDGSDVLRSLQKKLVLYIVLGVAAFFAGIVAILAVFGASGSFGSVVLFLALLWLLVIIFCAIMGMRFAKNFRNAKAKAEELKKRRLSEDMKRESLAGKISSYRKLEREARGRLAASKNVIDVFEKKYAKARPGGHGADLIKAIDKFRNAFNDMERDKEGFSRLNALRNEYKGKLDGLLDLYCKREADERKESPRELISRIRVEKGLYEERERSLEKARTELFDFLRDNDMAYLEELKRQDTGEGEDKNGIDAEYSIEELQNKMNSLSKELSGVKQRMKECDSMLLSESEKADARPELENEYKELCERAEAYEKKYELITKTMELLSEAKDRLSTSYMHDMRKAFEHYLSLLDDGDMRFMLDSDLKVEVEGGGRRRRSEYLSRGYGDLVNICTRLALISVMYKDEKPFIILDDPFVNLDEGKLEKALGFVKELVHDRQVIYFFCHPSRNPYRVADA